MRLGVIFSVILFLSGCSNSSEKKEHKSAVRGREPLPAEIKKSIEKNFPGAKPYSAAIDSLLRVLSPHGIRPNEILWGQSTCVDDITNTKNKMIHPEIKGPFSMGGLAGIPFTGVTGVTAFSHHVPEHGTALIFVAPHIGITAGGNLGQIVRHGQHHASSCCGALVGALEKLKAGELKTAKPSEDDYQENTIEQLALLHKDEILNAKEPLVSLTKCVLDESEARVTRYVKQAKERHFKFAVVVVGVIINTDFQHEDYLWIGKVAVKDIEKNVWIK